MVPTTAANLNIHAPAEWIEIYVTSDASCTTGGTWQPFAQSVPVTLVPDVLTKNAITYVVFRNFNIVADAIA